MFSVGLRDLGVLLLVVAVSVDTFVAGLAYGIDGIKIPFTSAAILNFICSCVLVLSLGLGNLIKDQIDPWAAKSLCFTILIILGMIKLSESAIKSLIKKNKWINRSLSFSAFHLRFILQVYANPASADRDDSKILTIRESASLGIALSLDGFAVGFGAGLTDVSKITTLILSLLFGLVAITFGSFIGRQTNQRLKKDISWLGGAFLIALAIQKLL